jgi:hypothetical protein
MNSISIAIIVLVCLIAGASLGMTVRATVAEHHVSHQSLEVVRLATGLMATLVALVLGLLINSANTARNTTAGELDQTLAGALLLDRYLAAYGQDTLEARKLLRHSLHRRFQIRWPAEDFGPPEPAMPPESLLNEMEQQILLLVPRNDAQSWLRVASLQLADELARTRMLLVTQRQGNRLPVPILVVLIAWSTAIFISFGLFVRPNATAILSLSIAACAVAAAIFLVLELNNTFAGFIPISSAPAHAALDALGT